MVAVGLLSVVIMALLGIFLKLMNASTKSANLSVGQSLAESILEQSLRVGPPGWGVPRTAVDLYAHDARSGTEFAYRVLPIPLGTLQEMGQMWEVEVRVYWWDGDLDSGERVEQGRLWTVVRQLHYLETQ